MDGVCAARPFIGAAKAKLAAELLRLEFDIDAGDIDRLRVEELIREIGDGVDMTTALATVMAVEAECHAKRALEGIGIEPAGREPGEGQAAAIAVGRVVAIAGVVFEIGIGMAILRIDAGDEDAVLAFTETAVDADLDLVAIESYSVPVSLSPS
jgi:hypothetical protein